MEFDLDKSIQILENTPMVLISLLGDLPDEWTMANEGDNTWSPFDILGHLVHGEKTDWMTRTKLILSDASNKTFDSFDRFAQIEDSKGKTILQLLSEFAELRSSNIAQLRELNIQREQFELKATHLELGEVNLKQLLSTWVVHDLGHINQITRVMSKQYASEVGPWTEFIGVLNK